MANDLLVRILGDTRGLERSFATANKATAQFGRNVESTGKKADRAAKNFASFGKGAAAGFGGAIAFNVALEQLRGIVTASAEAQQVLGQTRVAVESTGKSWAEYGDTIDKAIQSQSRLGFDDEALLRTFSLFVRQSKDVGEALRRNNIAMDLARARFIDLEQAALLVNKAALGQAGALRRVGIDARTGASGVELLAQLEREFGGAAEKAGKDAQTSFDRLAVSAENVQETLGSFLIPTLGEVAATASEGADAVSDLVLNLNRLANTRVPGINIPINFQIPGTGTTAGGAIKSGLKKALRVQFLGPLGIALNAKELFEDDPATNPNTNAAAKNFEKRFTGFLGSLGDAAEKGTKQSVSAAKKVAAFGEKGFKPLTQSLKQVREARNEAIAEAAAIAQERRDIAADQLLAGLSLQIDRAELTSGLRDDVLALQTMKGGLEGLIRQGQDVEENQARLVATIGQIAAKRQEIADRARDALQGRQFRAIGLTAEGGDIIPGVDNLRKQFESLSRRLVGNDVPRKLQDRLKLVGRFLAKGAKDATEETRAAIRDLFQEIRGTFDEESAKGPLTKTTSLNAHKLLDDLGLGRDLEKELRARLSSFNSAGKALASGGTRPTGQFVGGATVVVENHNTTTLDGDVVGRNVTKSQQKSARRNPRQKRGPNSGI